MPLVGVQGAGSDAAAGAANPADGSRHRVYLERDAAVGRGLLQWPARHDWAFFVRCVIDADGLRPTASRESLYVEDGSTRGRSGYNLGDRIRDLAGAAGRARTRGGFAAFLGVHALGVKAPAQRTDHELLRIMLDHLRFETTDGPGDALAEFARNHPTVYLAPTAEEFRQVAPIASAQGIGVVNAAASTYDDELVSLLPQILAGVTVAGLDAEGDRGRARPGSTGGRAVHGAAARHRPPAGNSTRWTATCCLRAFRLR